MATIELYKDKINSMSNYIEQAKNAVSDFCVDLSALKSKILGINSSVCDNVVSSISSSSQTQEQQIAGLEATQKQVNAFIDLTINRDNFAADAVSKAKEEFYKEYSYLKPECEKSGWENFCDGLKKIDEFCKDLWNEISNSKFFDFIGRIIHTQNFRDLVEYFVGIFYQVGGVNLIKSLSAIGTYCAVFQRKHPLLATLFGGVGIIGNLTQLFYYVTLNAIMDDNGVYHMIPDCWQQNTHYSTGYDDVFRSAVNEASGGSITVDVHQSNIFWVDLDGDNIKDDGEEFIIWSWKGDYMNLGAGAETGIYQVRNGDIDEYGNYINRNNEYSYLYAEVNREYSVNMSLELSYDNNGDGIFSANERLYSYEPTEEQWWITGFDPQTQNVKSDELKAVTTIDFSSYGNERGEIFYEAFKEKNYDAERDEYDEWIWDDEHLTVTLDWRN